MPRNAQTNRDPIFIITAVAKKGRTSRPFGFYHGKSEALKTVQSEVGAGIEECLYTHVVVESATPGIVALSKTVQWFRWNGCGWSTCRKPKWARGLINWGIG